MTILVPGGGLPGFIFRQVTALRDLVETARLHARRRPNINLHYLSMHIYISVSVRHHKFHFREPVMQKDRHIRRAFFLFFFYAFIILLTVKYLFPLSF